MRIKEQLLKQQEQQMHYMGKFLDHIYDNVIVKNYDDIDIQAMEKDYHQTSRVTNNPKYKEHMIIREDLGYEWWQYKFCKV